MALTLSMLSCTPDEGKGRRTPQGRPWQVQVLADGSTQVFGLVPGRSTLAEAIAVFGERLEVALFQSPDGTLTAEAYYREVRTGGLTGRLILILSLERPVLEGLRTHSPRHERTRTGNLRYQVGLDDARVLEGARIRGITFVPTADLDEDIVRARFGTPEETLSIGEDGVHWLYASRGLAITISHQGKEFLRYVHPEDLGWLRSNLEGQARPAEDTGAPALP